MSVAINSAKIAAGLHARFRLCKGALIVIERVFLIECQILLGID